MKLTDEQLEAMSRGAKGEAAVVEEGGEFIEYAPADLAAELLSLRREKAERRFVLAQAFTAAALAGFTTWFENCEDDDPERVPPEKIAREAVDHGLATADEFLRRIGEGEK